MTPKQEAEIRGELALGGVEHALELVREIEVGAIVEFALFLTDQCGKHVGGKEVTLFLQERKRIARDAHACAPTEG